MVLPPGWFGSRGLDVIKCYHPATGSVRRVSPRSCCRLVRQHWHVDHTNRYKALGFVRLTLSAQKAVHFGHDRLTLLRKLAN